jgi:hypothetical protein
VNGIEIARSGLGDIQKRHSLVLPRISIGGVQPALMHFLLAPEDFGDAGKTLETGIIGTEAIAKWHQGLQIIDLISWRYYLTGG